MSAEAGRAHAIDDVAEGKALSEGEQRKLKAALLFNHLFEACNILRGPINQDEFKAYVIPILFLKRISDCYERVLCAGCCYYSCYRNNNCNNGGSHGNQGNGFAVRRQGVWRCLS